MPQAPAPAPIAPQAPPAAPARNPLGITPGEETLIRRALSSGDPGQIAWAQGVLGEIEMRMASPSAERQEVVDQNGVKYLVDPTGANPPTPLFGDQGVPDLARTRNVVAGPALTVGKRQSPAVRTTLRLAAIAFRTNANCGASLERSRKNTAPFAKPSKRSRHRLVKAPALVTLAAFLAS